MTGRRSARGRGRVVSRRLRAVLAAAVVLCCGIGVTVTLASWTDREVATAPFTASRFDVEFSVNGSAYADNSTAPGATVTLAGPFLPGTTSYLPVLVRAKTGSLAGTVTLSAATIGGDATLGAALGYRVVRTTGACGASAFSGSPVYVVGSSATTRPLTNGQEAAVVNTVAAGGAAAPGAATGFCFAVTLPSTAASSLQGKTTTPTWRFIATSS